MRPHLMQAPAVSTKRCKCNNTYIYIYKYIEEVVTCRFSAVIGRLAVMSLSLSLPVSVQWRIDGRGRWPFTVGVASVPLHMWTESNGRREQPRDDFHNATTPTIEGGDGKDSNGWSEIPISRADLRTFAVPLSLSLSSMGRFIYIVYCIEIRIRVSYADHTITHVTQFQ